MGVDPIIIAAIYFSICSLMGMVFAFTKRKHILNYFNGKRKLRLEKKKTKIARKNYKEFIKMKDVNVNHALEALKDTNKTIVEISKTTDAFLEWEIPHHHNKKQLKQNEVRPEDEEE